MKYQLNLRDEQVDIDVGKDGVGFVGAVAGGGMHSVVIDHIERGVAVDCLVSLFKAVLEETDADHTAVALAYLRIALQEAGVLNDDVDMAVSLHGRVLPLDEYGSNIKKDR